MCSDEVFPKASYSSTLGRNKGDQRERGFTREVRTLPGGWSKSIKDKEDM